MKYLAIQGHPTRGKEVIKIFEMLGGNNKFNLSGNEDVWFVLNSNENLIQRTDILIDEKGFTFEEFFEKFPYKVGDRVSIPEYESKVRIDGMVWDGYEIQYSVFTDEVEWYTAAELNDFNDVFINMEDKENSFELKNEQLEVHSLQCNKIKLIINDELELIQEDGDYYIVRKNPQYPNTYKECCDILGFKNRNKTEQQFLNSCDLYDFELMSKISMLKVCRDAYWKMAGKEMGLGKPWNPDYANLNTVPRYYTIIIQYGDIIRTTKYTNDVFLTFPTLVMRDAFYENFKDLIDVCKGLL